MTPALRPGFVGATTVRRLPRATTAFAWILGTPVALVTAVSIVVAIATGDTSPTTIFVPLAGLAGLTVGAVLVTRLPHHRIGWLLWVGGLLMALTRITSGLADRGLTADPGSVPGAIWFAWLAAWIGPLALLITPVFLPLLYPTGRLPSPRWRPAAVVAISTLAADTVIAAFSPFSVGTYPPDVSNPLAAGGTVGDFLMLVGNVLIPVLFLVLAVGFASLVIRYRRSATLERQQLKWFAFVAAIALMALIVAAVGKGNTADPLATIDDVAWFVAIGGLALLPAAIGFAVLRYRLYEIDRLVSRTISWAVVTLLITSLFVALILSLQAILAPLTRSNELAVAASTLLVFTLFQPIRQRVQRVVDRRFNRARYDTERTVATFAGRLRDEVDLEQLRAEVLATVTRTVEPTSVLLWLRK